MGNGDFVNNCRKEGSSPQVLEKTLKGQYIYPFIWNEAKKTKKQKQNKPSKERNCSRPMSPCGRSGLSQVNHIYPISRSEIDEGRVELELENKCIQ